MIKQGAEIYEQFNDYIRCFIYSKCTFLYTGCPQSYKKRAAKLITLCCKVKVVFVKESSASLRQPVLRSSTATEGGGYALTGCLLLAKGNQPKADRHKMANGVVRIYKKLSL